MDVDRSINFVPYALFVLGAERVQPVVDRRSERPDASVERVIIISLDLTEQSSGLGAGLRLQGAPLVVGGFEFVEVRAQPVALPLGLCDQISGAPGHRRDDVSIAASARRRRVIRPSTRRCRRDRVDSMAWKFTKVHAIFLIT